MGARAAGGCLSALDPEVAMFQDEPVSAEAQQRHFGQVLGAAIGQPGLSAPGHSSLIAVDNRRAEPTLADFLPRTRGPGNPARARGKDAAARTPPRHTVLRWRAHHARASRAPAHLPTAGRPVACPRGRSRKPGGQAPRSASLSRQHRWSPSSPSRCASPPRKPATRSKTGEP